jgi:Peptidase M10 serralysin C terminal
VITDFEIGVDIIDLSAIDANSKHAGHDDFSFISFQHFHNAGELRESFSGGSTILSGDVNGDGKADFSILLIGHHLLHTGDFI